GELIRAFLASAAFPGIFSPVTIGDGMYADGGILDNFPVSPLKGLCDQIIGIYTSPIQIITPDKLRNSLSVLDRAIRINFSSGSLLKFSECDILIYPDALNKFSLFDRNHIDEIYQMGYQATKKKLREHRKAKIL
ncbi:MAG: patatin-like phospholipase family protein, partial [Bacteroidia bacterium]|nr:patatin-like phospholipase family protein [Bacteroidia bacterium]